MIPVYPFQEPIVDVDLFPQNLLNVQYFGFYGTCECYNDLIERNGLIRGYTPVSARKLKKLIRLLSKFQMRDDFDGQRSPKLRITDYLRNKEHAKLSFVLTAYEAIFYATNHRKAGQIYLAIQAALNYLFDECKQNSKWYKYIIKNFSKLILILSSIQDKAGVIYMIRFDNEDIQFCDYSRMTNANGAFFGVHYNNNLIREKIIGKIIIPCNTFLDDGIYMEAKNLSIRKNEIPGMLPNVIGRRNYYGN